MKNLFKLLALALFCTLITTSAYSITGYESSLILKKKMKTCSRYIHNTTDDRVIYQIAGMYNRRCIFRAYTLDSSMECQFKTAELKEFADDIPKSEDYQKIYSNLKEADSTSDLFKTYNLEDKYKKYITKGLCVIDGKESNNGN